MNKVVVDASVMGGDRWEGERKERYRLVLKDLAA
jgi:hypothetical protein